MRNPYKKIGLLGSKGGLTSIHRSGRIKQGGAFQKFNSGTNNQKPKKRNK